MPKPKLLVLGRMAGGVGGGGISGFGAGVVDAQAEEIARRHRGRPVQVGNVPAAAAAVGGFRAANVELAVTQTPAVPTYVFDSPQQAQAAEAELTANNYAVGYDRIVTDDPTLQQGAAGPQGGLGPQGAIGPQGASVQPQAGFEGQGPFASFATSFPGVSWNIQRVNAEHAWSQGVEGAGVTVAVVDTGVSPHQSFGGRLIRARAFLSDVNGNAVPENDQRVNLRDLRGHGTAVAGIIAGEAFTSSGRTIRIGMAPKASIVSMKVLGIVGGDPRFGYESDIIRGARAAMDDGAQVINLSLGFVDPNQRSANEAAWTQLVRDAEARGVLLVAASGNTQHTHGSVVGLPARLANVLSVGAVDRSDNLANFSTFGGNVPALAAPGVQVPSTLSPDAPEGRGDQTQLSEQSGTSFAAPHVSGAAALLLSAGRRIPADLRQLLASQVDPRTARRTGLGAGVLQLGPISNGGGGLRAETEVERRLRGRIEFWESQGFRPTERVTDRVGG